MNENDVPGTEGVRPEAAPQPQSIPTEPQAAPTETAFQPQPTAAPVAPQPHTAPEATYHPQVAPEAAAQPTYQPYQVGYQSPGTDAPWGSAETHRAVGAPQAAGAYQAPYGAPQDASWQSTGTVPPVPPASPYPGQSAPYGYEPSGSQQKRRWPWFLLGLAVGLLIGMGGCVSCAGIMAVTAYDHGSSYNYAQPINPGIDLGTPDGEFDPSDNDRNQGDRDGSGNQGTRPDTDTTTPEVGSYSLDEIKSVMFPDGAPDAAPADGDVCKEGIYTVGPKGQIPAGLYFLQGAEDAESRFFVFDGTDTPDYYKVDDSVVYFGNYFVELEEGDLIVFKPGADLTMYPAPATSFEPKTPYNDGCYRVGIDIPAGSYTITSYEPSAAVATADSGAYVMKDLDFDDDSIEESVYVIPGGKQVVTVKDGQYLELFAATATPVSQG